MLLGFCITTMFLIASFSATDTCGRYYSQAGTYCGATTFTHGNVEDPIVHMSICKTCGFPNYFSHSFCWNRDSLRHWQECEDCGYSTSKTRHTFSSIFGNAGNGHVYICTGCNYRRTEAHIWGDDNICDVCGKQDTSSLDPEEIIIDPVTE